MFLVTADYIASELRGKTFYVRVNTKDGKCGFCKSISGVKWVNHPNDMATDVALIPISFDSQKIDFSPIPVESFMTDADSQSRGIGAGEEAFITGLFTCTREIPKTCL